jgi:hypothetical protein
VSSGVAELNLSKASSDLNWAKYSRANEMSLSSFVTRSLLGENETHKAALRS